MRCEKSSKLLWVIASIAMMAAMPTAAEAELVLSQLVVDLGKPSNPRADIEIWNNGEDRAYVVAEPSEIMNPGTATEQRVAEPDPEKRGLLVSPARMILEPGQRRLIRMAAIGARSEHERVYRVTVKPVTGELNSADTGLKLLVGYDVLVLLRPVEPTVNVSALRTDTRITFKNEGNASVELADGKQCEAAKINCVPIAGKRIYAGAEWTPKLNSVGPVEFTLISGSQSVRKVF